MKPRIRFKEFTDSWIKRKLSDEFSQFIVPMRDKPQVFSGNIPWTRIEDIEGKYLNGSLTGQYVSEETINRMNLKIIPKGSLIVSSSASFGVVAVVTCDLITNQTFIGLVPNEQKTLDYWYSYFQSPEAHEYMKSVSAGSTIFYIARESFENMPVTISKNKNELIKIGSLFNDIDKTIVLHERKYEKLQSFKNGLLQKMFPSSNSSIPQIRFSKFKKEWKKKELGEVCDISKGTQLGRAEMLEAGDYYVLNGGMLPSGYTNVYNTKENTISISEGGNSCGYINYNVQKFWSGGHNYTISDEKIDNKYLYQYLKNNEMEIMSLRVGSGLPNIQKTSLAKFPVIFPDEEKEQKEIASVLFHLDNLIDLYQIKIEKLKNLRNGFLKNMFYTNGD